jgi:3',5'-nucleoside bisphosphate phosphatase
MREYRADLHIHTLLSPCGDLRMSPVNIISEAVKKGIDIIGITDHNTTRHCRLTGRIAAENGIFVMMGAEVTTREEVHCLVFFENTDKLDVFQSYLDRHLPEISNVPEIFGDQVEIDENENIVYTEQRLLTNATDISLEELEGKVHAIGGLFIPAHIDRIKNGLYGQLGLFPEGLKADALEVSRNNSRKAFAAIHGEIDAYSLITNSDAHLPEHIGRAVTGYILEKPAFTEMAMALKQTGGRRVIND